MVSDGCRAEIVAMVVEQYAVGLAMDEAWVAMVVEGKKWSSSRNEGW